jgi:hypothetical protein
MNKIDFEVLANSEPWKMGVDFRWAEDKMDFAENPGFLSDLVIRRITTLAQEFICHEHVTRKHYACARSFSCPASRTI